jgi:hypothetical protein
MAVILEGSVAIPAAETMWPQKSTSGTAKWHFPTLAYSWWVRRISNTACRWRWCSSADLEKMRMSSK